MSGPPAAPRPSTNTRTSPASSPEVRAVEIRDSDGELVRKISRDRADEIMERGLGDWHTATDSRRHVKLKTIRVPDRSAGNWMRPASVVRERLQRNTPGRELTTMFRFVDS